MGQPPKTLLSGASFVDILVFGTNTPSFPIHTSGDLETDPNVPQDVIARIPVDLVPADGWVHVSTTFTPTSEYSGIIIGPGAMMNRYNVRGSKVMNLMGRL